MPHLWYRGDIDGGSQYELEIAGWPLQVLITVTYARTTVPYLRGTRTLGVGIPSKKYTPSVRTSLNHYPSKKTDTWPALGVLNASITCKTLWK
jgi:hypothetical protein